jgi:hypothetical protein
MQIQFSALFKNSEAQSVDSLDLVVDLAGSTDQYLYDLDDKENPLGGGWRVSNGRKPDEDEVTLQISVKYSNYLVAKSVISIVDDWYKATKRVRLLKKSFAFSFLWRFDPYEFFTPIGFVVKFIPMLIATSIAWGVSRSSFSFVTEGYRVLTSIVVGVIIYIVADGALRGGFQAMKNVRGSVSVRLLMINPADQKAMSEYLTSIDEKKEHYDFWTKIIGAGIAVSILATGITTFLLGWH